VCCLSQLSQLSQVALVIVVNKNGLKGITLLAWLVIGGNRPLKSTMSEKKECWLVEMTQTHCSLPDLNVSLLAHDVQSSKPTASSLSLPNPLYTTFIPSYYLRLRFT